MQRALDLGLFINGLPIATFELKNNLTKQTVEDAVQQYQRDRDPRERLLQLGRCVVHFAVDDHEVRFCTHLKGKGSWFLPFNLGWNDGAGNPPNPNGLKTDYLAKRKSRYQATVAFSGEHEYGGAKVTEASLNGFPSRQIADKFQTGYDEPLLHTMYVDKQLSGIKAVQTLSRLNRAHPKRHDVFVLDFMNDADAIQQAFADYYRTTILAEETDPDKLHDL
jgi:type I site-specific restriction-modification system R (restriction) subunit